MTIKRNIVFCLLLVAGAYVYGMDNKTLQDAQPEKHELELGEIAEERELAKEQLEQALRRAKRLRRWEWELNLIADGLHDQ